MATVAEIKKTPAYRALAPYIRRKDRNELARMMSLVTSYTCFYEPDSVDGLFNWAATPQGHDYWHALHMSLLKSGAYAEMGVDPVVGV